MRAPSLFPTGCTLYLIAGVFALDHRFALADGADPTAQHDAVFLVGVFDSLRRFDRPAEFVLPAALLGFLGPLGALLGVLGVQRLALRAVFRLPRSSLGGFSGVPLLRRLLRRTETLAEFPVLCGALRRLGFVVIDDAGQKTRTLARFTGDGAFIERIGFGSASAFANPADDLALPNSVMTP